MYMRGVVKRQIQHEMTVYDIESTAKVYINHVMHELMHIMFRCNYHHQKLQNPSLKIANYCIMMSQYS